MNPRDRQKAEEAWEKASSIQTNIGFTGMVLIGCGVAAVVLPWFFTSSVPEWIVGPAAVTVGVGILISIVGALWPVPDLPPTVQDIGARERALHESHPRRLALAKSTDTSKAALRNLAQTDPSADVRRAAIETLALLKNAGL